MRYLGVFASFLALTSALPFEDIDEFGLETRAGKDQACPPDNSLHFVIVSEFNQPIHDGYGTMGAIMDELKKYIPNTSNYSVPYPKNETDSSQYAHTAAVGARHTRGYIRRYMNHCPTTAVVVMGYSEGALIANNGLCGRSHKYPNGTIVDQAPLNSKYAENIIAVVTFGDPSYVSGLPYDEGTCTAGQGPVNARATPSNCDAFANAMATWCDYGDYVCCGLPNYNQHGVYLNKYGHDAGKYVYDKWQERNQKKLSR